MDVYEAVDTRRAVRAFSDEPVPLHAQQLARRGEPAHRDAEDAPQRILRQGHPLVGGGRDWVFFDFPWILAYLVLGAAWVGGPVILLVLGLVHLLRHARHRWWSAACWLIMLAAGVAIGFLIMHGYRLLFSAYPTDIAGEPLGPSRWAPSGPYWLALVAAGGELAVGAVLITLVNASPGKLSAGFRLTRDRTRR